MIAKALSPNLTGYARGNLTIMVKSSASDKQRHSKDMGGVRRREFPLVRQTDAPSTITAAITEGTRRKNEPREECEQCEAQ